MHPLTREGLKDLGWALLWCACPPLLVLYSFYVAWELLRSTKCRHEWQPLTFIPRGHAVEGGRVVRALVCRHCPATREQP